MSNPINPSNPAHGMYTSRPVRFDHNQQQRRESHQRNPRQNQQDMLSDDEIQALLAAQANQEDDEPTNTLDLMA